MSSPSQSGTFERKTSHFRATIPSERYPAEKGRYVLYMNNLCPWAHRTILTLALKGLEEIVQMVEVDSYDRSNGWTFSGRHGPDQDPITGVKTMRELYKKVEPGSLENGIASIPVLFDKKSGTIVNNESSEIIRIFYSAFDELLPEAQRESNKGEFSLLPSQLKTEIEVMNAWVYEQINNGVYKAGFASTSKAYDAAVLKVYDGLDRLEMHLSDPAHQPYIFGKHVTEADIRLFPTILRFDLGYVRFLNRKPGDANLIREKYPKIDRWLRNLYWDSDKDTNGGAFNETTDFEKMREGITKIPGMDQSYELPDVNILPALA